MRKKLIIPWKGLSSVPIFLWLGLSSVPIFAGQIRFSVFDISGRSLTNSTTVQQYSAGQTGGITKLTGGGAVALYVGYYGQDLIAPSAVTNLTSLSPDIGQIRFSWTAPFNDAYPSPGVGNITSGYFRIMAATYTAFNFTPSSYTVSVATSMTQGVTRIYVVTGLSLGATYYSRIWHCDENFNWSPVSNGTTLYLPDVSTNPYSPSGLAQFAGSPEASLGFGSWTNDTALRLQFTQSDANAGDNLRFTLDISSYQDFSFIYVTTTSAYLPQGATNYAAPALPDSTSWYWRVRSQDDSQNNYLSPHSTANAGGAAFRLDTKIPSAISSLTALAASIEAAVTLSWISPGDDGTYGDVGSGIYRIKSATYSIMTPDFDNVIQNPPYTYSIDAGTSSIVPMSVQTYLVTGLNPGTTYYFAIKFIDKAGNISSWSSLVPGSTNFAPSPDLVPLPPPGITATPVGQTSIDVSWDLPSPPSFFDDRDRYELFRATYVFTSTTSANVILSTSVSHPMALFHDSGIQNTTYYYRMKTWDRAGQGNGIFSTALDSELSLTASTVAVASIIGPVVTMVYDNHSILNLNNYGAIDGIEDADGTVGFDWPKVIGGGTIGSYFIEISTDPVNFGNAISSATIPASVSTYSASGLIRGNYYYGRVRAKNSDGDFGQWTASDGIYVNRRTVNGDVSDWTGAFSASTNTVVVAGGDALWRDALSDGRYDKGDASQLDITSVAITADEYNLYLFINYASTVSAGFDGRNLLQVMIDNDATGTERVFRGRNVIAEDSYVSNNVPWERVFEIVSGNDIVRCEDSAFANRRYGAYSEDNSKYLYEVSIPLSALGGSDKVLGRTVNFTIATFWNGGGGDGSIGQWAANYPNAVDCVTNRTDTWSEVSDKVIDFYLAVTFSTGGVVTAAKGILESYTAPPAEPETADAGISPAPPAALDYSLYNIFIDAFQNGDPTNDDVNDVNSYGGDFQGVIDKVNYFNDMGINMAYFGPPTQFGGGIWGFNIDDAYKHMPRFGGTSKYIEMVKTLHNHNVKVMVDWVCGQVGSQNSPTAVKHPDYFRKEQFGWGTKQEFAEPRAYWLNNMVWYFSICDAFRYDNPKFWNGDAPEYGFGWEAYDFNKALRMISDRWDPQLFIMGEIPEDVSAVNDFTGNNGAMIHGGEDMRSGGYKNNRDAHICSWVRPGTDAQTTITSRTGIDNQQVTWKNQWSINPVMMENHDEQRFISRGRDLPANAPWHQQVGYMTAITVGGPAILFYGGELGLEGPYDGTNAAKMDKDGNVRAMPWDRVNDGTWGTVQSAIRRAVQAKANFNPLRGDPKKGGRSWYTGGQYDGEVMVWTRTWGGSEKVIVMANRNNNDQTLTTVGTGDASTLYKDWLTDTEYNTDGSGNIGSIVVPSHYMRILVKGGYDWGNVTGTVLNSGGQPVPGAIVDIDQKSHWTTTADNSGYYSISGNMKKVIMGNHTIRAWSPGYGIQSWAVYVCTGSGVNNNFSFTAASGHALTVDNTPPAQPSTLGAKPRDKAVMLFWQANGESDLSSYLIYRSQSPIPDGSNPSSVFEVFKTFYYDNDTDNGLTNGVTYYYRIRAVDRNGNKSALSNQVAVAPRAVNVKFWVDTRDSGYSITNINLGSDALTVSKDYFGQVQLNSNGDGTYERTFEFDDTTFLEYKYVINGVTWEFGAGDNRGELMNDANPKIEVVDEGDGTMILADTWGNYNDLAPRTVGGIAVNTGPNMITVGWTKNAEPDLSYYQLQRSSYSSVSGFSDYTRCGKNEIKFVDVNLINGNTYYYKIKAVDRKNNSSAYSGVYSGFPVAADSSAPGAPSGIAAYGAGNNGLSGIELKWDANFEGDIAGYNVYRTTYTGFTAVASNKINSTLVRPTSAPTYTDATASSGVQYYYKVIALDDSGNSSNPSAERAAKLVPVTFNIDMGGVNPSNVRAIGYTQPFDTSGKNQLTNLSASSWSITLGFVSGTTLQYKYAYNGLSVQEQDFTTASHNRELAIPYSTATVNNDWEENPEMVNNVKAYPGAGKAYVYWDQNYNAEDLAGYNIYYTTQSGITPDKKFNASPVSYTQPYAVTGLSLTATYYFAVKNADSGYQTLESTAVIVTSPVYPRAVIYVNFGVPYKVDAATSPWGDSSRIKLYLTVQSSTDTAVWSTSDRANITNGKLEMTGVGGGYRASVALLRGEKYNFAFFAQTTNNPPTGLPANTEYYDTVPNTGTFVVSTSSFSVAGPQAGNFYPCGTNRDARRLIDIPDSLTEGSTWYVFANFGSSPTAPTYVMAVPGDQKVTLYWSAPYGRSWVTIINNTPLGGGGESMKAADVVAGGVYQIYMANTNPGSFASYSATATVSGGTFSYTIGNLNNNTTYYFILRSSDTFKPSPDKIEGNNYSVWSSTVNAFPTANKVPVRIRAWLDLEDGSSKPEECALPERFEKMFVLLKETNVYR